MTELVQIQGLETKKEAKKATTSKKAGKKPRVLLIYKCDHYERDRGKMWIFPIGIAMIGAVTRTAGYDVEVLDLNAKPMSDEEVRKYSEDFDVIGFSALAGTNLRHVLHYIDITKRPDNKIVIGGPLAESETARFLKETKTDCVVVGEGESTFLQLLEDFPNTKKVYIPKERAEFADLPLPAYDMFDFEQYTYTAYGRKAAAVFSARGCPFRCTFCNRPFKRKWRSRDATKMVEQVRHLYENYGVRFVRFYDENFVVNRQRVYDFCEMMKESGMDVKWMCALRADNRDKEDLYRLMHEAGCIGVNVGIESGSPKVLKLIKKDITPEMIQQNLEQAKQVPMTFGFNFMVGLPDETPIDAYHTLKVLWKVKRIGHVFNIGFFSPRPGSELYQTALQRGRKPMKLKEWADYEKQTHQQVNLTKMPEFMVKLYFLTAMAIQKSDWKSFRKLSFSGTLYFLHRFFTTKRTLDAL